MGAGTSCRDHQDGVVAAAPPVFFLLDHGLATKSERRIAYIDSTRPSESAEEHAGREVEVTETP